MGVINARFAKPLDTQTLFRAIDETGFVITVEENPIINRVIFEGNSGLKEDKLRDEVTVRPRGIFTRAKAQGDDRNLGLGSRPLFKQGSLKLYNEEPQFAHRGPSASMPRMRHVRQNHRP